MGGIVSSIFGGGGGGPSRAEVAAQQQAAANAAAQAKASKLQAEQALVAQAKGRRRLKSSQGRRLFTLPLGLGDEDQSKVLGA